MDTPLVYPAAACAAALVAAWTDVRSRRIPNWLTGPGLLVAFSLHGAMDGWRGALTSAAACLIAGVIFLLFYFAGGMGAGDVKLIAAVAALAGLQNTAMLLVYTSLAGGLMAVIVAVRRGRLRQTLANTAGLLSHHGERGLTPHDHLNVRNAATLRLPYGVAIAAGCLMTLYVAELGA